mmetsp:Transcript_27538/g.37755  ORF Transcript_27538/g.37755 Transcript_27538/m.37755 type:complete len:81 (+) Transcript_27538:174-416(+)
MGTFLKQFQLKGGVAVRYDKEKSSDNESQSFLHDKETSAPHTAVSLYYHGRKGGGLLLLCVFEHRNFAFEGIHDNAMDFG